MDNGTGYRIARFDPAVQAWARAAKTAMQGIDTSERRHGNTWFVGVDALPNAPDGSIDGVVLPFGEMTTHWHQAQVSIVYDGYPKQDAGESDAAHRFRLNRDAAHMDGLLPVGAQKRRYLCEPHGFILGIALNDTGSSALVVWEGSHTIMQTAFQAAFAHVAPDDFDKIDVTDIYQAARREVFAKCERVEVPISVGEAVIAHRHLIHGVAPWQAAAVAEGRMIAYFRPLIAPADWL